ncbi:MAG TPA: hypothetical protein VF834_22810 [Streptosporangiaceae bacterium]
MTIPGRRPPRSGITTITCAWLAAVGTAVAACTAPGQHGGLAPHATAAPLTARAAGAVGQPTSSPPTGVPRSASATRSAGRAGSFWTGERWLTLTEPAHTGPTGQALGPRKLLTEVLYPLASEGKTAPAKGPLPMIVFGPGFMQCGGPYSRLLRYWASAGYVVVVVNFPLSDCKTGPAATESDLVNQPHDMSYAITAMLARSAAGHGFFAGLLSPREIAVTGQSDGGDTVAAMAASSCCTDRRPAAVAVLSGAEWPPMPGSYFSTRPAPMLFTQGSADTVNWPGCSVTMYHSDPAWARYYLDLLGASHTGPYWGVNKYERVAARVTLAFFDRYVLRQSAAGPAMSRLGDVSGISALYEHGGGKLPSGPCN